MDLLTLSRIGRAEEILRGVSNEAAAAGRARTFTDFAHTLLRARATKTDLGPLLARSPDDLLRKAAAHLTLDDVWADEDMQTAAGAYLASIADGSLLDQIVRFATPLPKAAAHVLVASGATANLIAEGLPKIVTRLALSVDSRCLTKAAAIVVLSNELARAIGGPGRAMFESELRSSITAATNSAVLNCLSSSSDLDASAGANALDALRNGLAAAPTSTGYVVAAKPSQVQYLATCLPNSGLGVRGGDFCPGVSIVPVEGVSSMTIIPASRLAVQDMGLELRPSDEVALDMADSPSAPAQMVSMWQTDSTAILAERQFVLAGNPQIVRVA